MDRAAQAIESLKRLVWLHADAGVIPVACVNMLIAELESSEAAPANDRSEHGYPTELGRTF